MTVSVMITTRNRIGELRRTLDQLEQMDPFPFEVWIVADGCTDSTVDYVQTHHSDAQLIVHEHAIGSVASRAEMMRQVTGELVLALDDDSYPEERDCLRILLAAAGRETVRVRNQLSSFSSLFAEIYRECDDFGLLQTWQITVAGGVLLIGCHLESRTTAVDLSNLGARCAYRQPGTQSQHSQKIKVRICGFQFHVIMTDVEYLLHNGTGS